MVTVDLVDFVLGGIARPAHRQPRASSICRGVGNRVGHFWRRKRFWRSNENSARSAGPFTSWTGIVCTVAHDSGHERERCCWQQVGWTESANRELRVIIIDYLGKDVFWDRERCKWRGNVGREGRGG